MGIFYVGVYGNPTSMKLISGIFMEFVDSVINVDHRHLSSLIKTAADKTRLQSTLGSPVFIVCSLSH